MTHPLFGPVLKTNGSSDACVEYPHGVAPGLGLKHEGEHTGCAKTYMYTDGFALVDDCEANL